MGEVTSKVNLIVHVDGLKELQDAQKALEELEKAAGKGINIELNSKDIKHIGQTLDDINSKFKNLGEGANLSNIFGDTSWLESLVESLDLLIGEVEKITGTNADTSGMVDTSGVVTALNEVGNTATDVKGKVESALAIYNGNGVTTSQNNVTKNIAKDSKSATKEVTGLTAAVSQLNKVASNGTGQAQLDKMEQALLPYSNFDSKNVDKATKSLEGARDILKELDDVTNHGKVDARDALNGAGYNDEAIVNMAKNYKDSVEQIKSSTDEAKIELQDLSKAQKDINKNMTTGNTYQQQADNIQKMISGFSEIDTKELSDVRTQLQGFYADIEVLQNNAKRNGGQVDVNDLIKTDNWTPEKVLNFSNSLKQLNAQAKTTTDGLKSLGIDNKFLDNLNNGSYEKQVNDLRQSINSLGDSQAKASLNDMANSLEGTYTNMQNAIGSGTAEGYQKAAGYAEEFTRKAQEANDVLRQFFSGGSTSSGGGGGITGITGGFSGSGFMSELSGVFNDILPTLNKIVGYNAIYRQVRQMARDMVDTVTEIDTAMNQLQIVTGASGSEMSTFFESSISQAKELGQSVTDVLDTIQVYSRLGYNLEEASELAEYTSILSNVAAVDVEDATTGLTSVIKGFDLDVSDAEHVADVLIDIGQNYAVSASEILEAFTHSSAAFGATGTTFEEAAAIIAAGNAAVQDASTVGTALKTVSARIRRSTTELDELGESYDDLAGGFAKYRDELMSLTGFDIMEEGSLDDFKSIYDIFDGIAQVWDNLSETSQSRVSEILGGTRQLQVISSIINNWDDAADAYAEAMDSAGVATEAQATHMESLEAKTKQFNASMQEFYYDFLDSDVAKGVVDFGTDAVNILDGMVDSIGSVSTAIVALGAGSIFKGVVWPFKGDTQKRRLTRCKEQLLWRLRQVRE